MPETNIPWRPRTLRMTRQQSELFLRTLVSDLLAECSHWSISDHCKIEWSGRPRNMWPEADILIDTGTRRFIIEYDEDSDPGRSLTKYWPIVHHEKGLLTIIEVWKRGSTVGRGHAELAKWMATRLKEMYPTFDYELLERIEETSRPIARAITQIIKASL